MNYDGDDDDDERRDHWQEISTTLNEFIAHKKKIGKSNDGTMDGAMYCEVDPNNLFSSKAWNYVKRRTTDLTS